VTHPVPSSAILLLAQAKQNWAAAALERGVAEKYRVGHIAALRAAAAVLARRARPSVSRQRPTSVWVLLDSVAPELADWAVYFADSARRRAAIEAGAFDIVSEREADDLMRAVGEFIAIVERNCLTEFSSLAS
jgi:hypothetical protein